MFKPSTRPTSAPPVNGGQGPRPFSSGQPSVQFGKSAAPPSAGVGRRATPSPRNVCRRLVRDYRYGYVEVQFAC